MIWYNWGQGKILDVALHLKGFSIEFELDMLNVLSLEVSSDLLSEGFFLIDPTVDLVRDKDLGLVIRSSYIIFILFCSIIVRCGSI
jgi:hypothetical protein